MASSKDSKSPPFILLCQCRASHLLFGFLYFVALTIFLRFRAVASLNSHVLGGAERDAGLYLWLTEAFHHALANSPSFADLISAVLNLPGFFPYTLTLAWSDNFLLPAALASLFAHFTLTPIGAYNVVLLLAQFLNGLSMFVLCLRLTASPHAAVFAGSIWASSSFFTAHLGHPQLQFALWFPLGTLLLLRSVESMQFRSWFLCGLTIVGAFLTTVYYAIFLAFLFFLLLGLLCVLRPQVLTRLVHPAPLLGLGLSALILSPFLLPYLSVQSVFGTRYLHEPHYFSAHLVSYFSASTYHWLFGWTSQFSHSEAHLWVGLTTVAVCLMAVHSALGTRHLRLPLHCLTGSILAAGLLATPVLEPSLGTVRFPLGALASWLSLACIIWWLRRLSRLESLFSISELTNRSLLALCFAGALVVILLSFGPYGFGAIAEGQGLGVYRLFYEGFPGFSAARAIGRIGLLTIFLLCLTSAIGLAYLLRSEPSGLSSSHRLIVRLSPLLLIVGVAEHLHRDYPVEEPPALPPVFSKLRDLSRNGEVAIVLPFAGALTDQGQVARWGEFARLNVNAARFALTSGVPVVNGYSGIRSKIIREWPARLESFPDAASLRALGEIAGLRWIVLLPSPQVDLVLLKQSLTHFAGKLSIIYEDEQGLLIELSAARNLDTAGAALLAPSFPEGILTLELSMAPLASAEPSMVEVVDLDSGLTIASLPVMPDGSWKLHSFRVGQVNPRTNPIRMGFSVDPESAGPPRLFVRRSFYESTGAGLSSTER